LAKEATLNAVSSKLDNLNVEVDLSGVAKQGENQEATNSAIYEAVKGISIDGITIALENLYYAEFVKNNDGDNTYTMIIPAAAKKEDDTIII
jgi:hypothetical protein